MSAPKHRVQRTEPPPERPPAPGALSPLPITSRPVRARLDRIKAEMSADYRRRLGRPATWNEVLEQLLNTYDGWQAEARGRT